jgi:hypothetical protein
MMMHILELSVVPLVILLFAADWAPAARDRPVSSPSRYGFTLKFDAKSLPAGIRIREVRSGNVARYFIKNTGQSPLIINSVYHNDRLVSGAKLVDGKVYNYFPDGVPMAGKRHLKGWQAPFGVSEETLLTLAKEPQTIYAGRKPGLSKTLPPSQPISIPVQYNAKPYTIEATVLFHLNPAYDTYYKQPPLRDADKPADGTR